MLNHNLHHKIRIRNYLIILYVNKYKLLFLFILTFIYISLYHRNKKETKLIKVAYYSLQMKYGGIERVFSIIIKYLSKEKYFSFYLITKYRKQIGEYPVPNNVKRISLTNLKMNLYEALEKEKIDILIYNYEDRAIEKLNQLKKTKVIYYNHSSFLYWIYKVHLYNFKDTVYHLYKKCKYVISLIPVENDYLFKKWGINSILMDNPSTFELNSVIPSNLINKNIIMIGRGNDPIKRYDLGIMAMKEIIKEIPNCIMNIVSTTNLKLVKLIKNLKLENNVKFTGYQNNIEYYLKNSSLHILSSLSESYPMVLGEAKIFGIPSIICGLDHLALAKEGTVIVYDDNPLSIAKEAIKILKDDDYRRKLGKEARESMKKRTNDLIAKKWVKILLSVYNGNDKLFHKSSNDNKISEKEAIQILKNQLKLLQKRNHRFSEVSFEKFIAYSLS